MSEVQLKAAFNSRIIFLDIQFHSYSCLFWDLFGDVNIRIFFLHAFYLREEVVEQILP